MTTFQHATVNGLKLFYREAGSKASPTIVLLHGFPSSSHMFRDLIPQLAEKFHVIAPDYIGFGYSDAPAAGDFVYTFDNLAAHVKELLFGVPRAQEVQHLRAGLRRTHRISNRRETSGRYRRNRRTERERLRRRHRRSLRSHEALLGQPQ
jgi:alpha/beta hydrolase fold